MTRIRGIMVGAVALAFALAFALCGCTSSGTATASEAGSGESTASGIGLENGTYTATFTTDSSMFHVNDANEGKGLLTVTDDGATIHVSLVSKKVVNLYPGLAEDAQKEGAVLLEPTVDTVIYSDGTSEEVYGFDVPVPALDEDFDLALLGEKGTWYDHKVSVSDPKPGDEVPGTAGTAGAASSAGATGTAGAAHEASKADEEPAASASGAASDTADAESETSTSASGAADAESEASESASGAADASVSKADQAAADEVAALIDAIYVQTRTDQTDEQCAAAKAAWDALTPERQELVEGEHADPGYFGDDTGDAKADDPLNDDGIGEDEILVASFGTSYNDSRVKDIGAIERAIQAAVPDWSVRRAFTSQIIINHIQARDGEAIDNVEQALARAEANGVKRLVVAPTHLMHGHEYNELAKALEAYRDSMEIVMTEPLLGEVGADATVINDDKKAVAEAVVAAAVEDAGYASAEEAAADGTAFVFLGHGTSHIAKVTYDQMQTQMAVLGYENAFIGTVEGEPEDTACDAVIGKVEAGGYQKVVLRPLMVVAGDHAHNDMADLEDDESWASQFLATGAFESVDCQIAGLGGIPAVQERYVEHVKAVLPE